MEAPKVVTNQKNPIDDECKEPSNSVLIFFSSEVEDNMDLHLAYVFKHLPQRCCSNKNHGVELDRP